jgi:hypothetical protein
MGSLFHEGFVPESGNRASVLRLWVREMFQTTSDSPAWVMYAADSEMRSPTGERKGCLYQGPWKPSIHMPRKFSRIALEIVDVRVQRLQEISEEDAIVEGSQMPLIDLPKRCQQATLSERTQFSRLWDSINAKRAPWASDPWVWVITFRGVNA